MDQGYQYRKEKVGNVLELIGTGKDFAQEKEEQESTDKVS